MNQRFVILILSFIGYFETVRAQTPIPQWQSTISVGGFANTGTQAPFWLMANQYGTTPSGRLANAYRFRVFKPFRTEDSTLSAPKRNWDYSFAIEPILNLSSGNLQGVLPEAALGLRYRKVMLSLGRSKSLIGLQDSTLSSGSLLHGANALPMPRLLLSTVGFKSLPFWDGLLGFNVGFGVGLNNGTYIKKSYFHQKYLFLKIGRSSSTFQFYMGAHHEVIWGGQADYLRARPDFAKDGKLPSSLKYWSNILFSTRPRQSDDLAPFDQDYRIGNHVGSYQLGLSWKSSAGYGFFYHQHPFEDVSGAALQNLPDGLYGFSWTPRKAEGAGIRRLVAEYLNTYSQSGSSFLKPNSIFQGNDNYYNHSQYQQGWSYRSRAIGTPFVLPGHQLRQELVEGRPFYFPNNRVQAFYLAAEADLSPRLRFQGRLSHTRNKGTHEYPFDRVLGQTSMLVSGDWLLIPKGQVHFKSAFAWDTGGLLPSNSGIYLSFYKTFAL